MSSSVEKPDLGQLRIQAKELLRAVRAGDPAALARVVPYFGAAPEFKLANSQTVIARENGFDSWPQLWRTFEAPSQESPGARLFQLIESGKDQEAIEMLRQNRELAGTWQRTQYGWTSPLHSAAQHGRLQIARELVELGAQVYAVTQGGYPPVFDSNDRELTEYLLQASAERDEGLPPTYGCGIDIVLASRLGMLERVRMHVERDPFAVFRRGCIGESVAHWPAHNSYPEVLGYVLDHGLPIETDEIGLYGGKPLHWASEHTPACVELLLARGADPNSLNHMDNEFKGYTPLHMAARQREECVECAEKLLRAGADPSLQDAKGHTALDIARESEHERMARFLSER